MPLAPATRLGPYEIQSALGAGGMGEVFRARDTRLDRTVAIKVLAQHLSATPEIKERFEREARAISSLSHPNICALYDIGQQDGIDYLVMELLQGETLADRLAKGALPLKELLKIGAEVCDALDAAHRSGIVHRDLKPGNIMLTKSGAKLMDFGLAKSAAAAAASAGNPLFSAAQTIAATNSPLTTAGQVIGTIQYMSPEQIEGRPADARSDIFALGAVLYEMATGKRAFNGKSQLSIASAILEHEPAPISSVQPLTPASLEQVIQTCLAKNPDERFQSVHDVKLQLKWAAGATPASPVAKERRSRTLLYALTGLVGILLIALAAVGLWMRRDAAEVPRLQAYLPAPPNHNFSLLEDDAAGPAVISADGASVAFVASDQEGKSQIWVRQLSSGETRAMPGTEGGTYPFWSPDGKWVAFFANNKLEKVALGGGMPLEVANAPRGRGGDWGANDIILLTPMSQSGIFSVPASGGEPVQITTPEPGVYTTHRWPQWISADKFIYFATTHDRLDSPQTGIRVHDVQRKADRLLVSSDTNAIAKNGYLLFMKAGVLYGSRFDPASATLQGVQVAVLQDVGHNDSTWRGSFDLAGNGVLITQSLSGIASQQGTSVIKRYFPGNKPPTMIAPPDAYDELRISPDGKSLALNIRAPQSALHIFDMKTGAKRRLTFEGKSDSTVAWSPDGNRLAFSQQDNGGQSIFVKNASGAGDQTAVVSSAGFARLSDWSPDGDYLVYTSLTPDSKQIGIVALDLRDHKARELVHGRGPATLCCARVSPNGQWLAYNERDESGKPQIFVTHFPSGVGKWQITTALAGAPYWRHDGKALIYSRGFVNYGTIMEIPVTLNGDSVQVGVAHDYLKTGSIRELPWSGSRDLATDGSLIVNELLGQRETTYITVHLNWDSELKKR